MTQRTQQISLLTALGIIAAVLVGVHWLTGNSRPAPTQEEVRFGLPSEDVKPNVQQGEPPQALFGYEPHKDESEQFIKSLPKPTIRDAGPQLFNAIGDEKEVLLYRPLYKAHRDTFGTDWKVGRQGIGDCVSWGWAYAADVHLAVMYCAGDSAEWMPTATESVYGGSRVEARGRSLGGWSDGSYGAAAAKWFTDYGLVFRKQYPSADLTNYSAKRAKDWGNYGNGGKDDAGKLDAEARRSPVRNVALVTNFDEAAAAISSGYPVPVCSMQGFSSRRDRDGFANPSGSWAHCMCFIGVRHGDRPGLLCLNSWGPTWISGPKYPDDMPDGSFWVDKSTANRMLSSRDSFAVSGYDGFPFQELDHSDWVVNPPQQEEETQYALAP